MIAFAEQLLAHTLEHRQGGALRRKPVEDLLDPGGEIRLLAYPSNRQAGCAGECEARGLEPSLADLMLVPRKELAEVLGYGNAGGIQKTAKVGTDVACQAI